VVKAVKKNKMRMISELKLRPLNLRLYPDSVLREIAEPLRMFNTVLQDFANDMLVLMKQHNGIGLAAPQVGILQRIVVADIGDSPICLVNPEIVAGSGTENMIEGCLSFPGYEVDVNRNALIEIRGKNLKGKMVDYKVEGLLARVLQHEVDHLNGILICDYGKLKPEIQDISVVDERIERDV